MVSLNVSMLFFVLKNSYVDVISPKQPNLVRAIKESLIFHYIVLIIGSIIIEGALNCH